MSKRDTRKKKTKDRRQKLGKLIKWKRQKRKALSAPKLRRCCPIVQRVKNAVKLDPGPACQGGKGPISSHPSKKMAFLAAGGVKLTAARSSWTWAPATRIQRTRGKWQGDRDPSITVRVFETIGRPWKQKGSHRGGVYSSQVRLEVILSYLVMLRKYKYFYLFHNNFISRIF